MASQQDSGFFEISIKSLLKSWSGKIPAVHLCFFSPSCIFVIDVVSSAAADGAAADMFCGYCFVILRRSGGTESSRRQRASACSPASLSTNQLRGMVRPQPVRILQAVRNLLSALCFCATMTQKQNKLLCFAWLCCGRAVLISGKLKRAGVWVRLVKTAF
ncbi:hypothetical protein AOLI_G00296580 [Acnodon oligacanthus]